MAVRVLLIGSTLLILHFLSALPTLLFILHHRRRRVLLRRHQAELHHALLTPLAPLVDAQDDVKSPDALVHFPHQPHDEALPHELLGDDEVRLVGLHPVALAHELPDHVILLGVREVGPFQDRHVHPLRTVGPLPRRRLEVVEHAERPLDGMAEKREEPTLVLLVVQLPAGEIRLHREYQVGGMTLDEPDLLRAEDARLDGRVNVHYLPILALVGLEDDDLVLLVVSVLGIGPDAMREGLSHALVQSLGGGSAGLGNVCKWVQKKDARNREGGVGGGSRGVIDDDIPT